MTNVSFRKMTPVNAGKDAEEIEVVEIERGPGNITAFPVNDEAEKDAEGRVITYGGKYAEYRDQPGHDQPGVYEHAIEPTPYDPDPSPDAHLYPPDTPEKPVAEKEPVL